MSNIEFGIGLPRLDEVGPGAQRAEALGYDFISTGEHVFFHTPINNGLISLAAAAGATSRIKLMSTITLVPLYPAALLAKQVASLDHVSNGRFHLGVGVGSEFAKEFEACGVPVNERGARTNESLAILQRLFTEDNVTFSGKFNQIPGLTLAPKPKQAQLPIWISGRSDAAQLRCATYGTGWLPYMYTPEQLETSLTNINSKAQDLGKTRQIDPGLFIFFAVHEEHQKGLDLAAERLSKQYNQDFTQLVHKYAIAGDPDHCVARLAEYIEAGARTIILNSACSADYTERNEALMAETVLPRLREML